MSNKSITFLIRSLNGGGAEGVCVNLANSISERGWDVKLVLLCLENEELFRQLSEKVKVEILGKKHARTAFFSLLKYVYNERPKKILVFNHQIAILLVFIRRVVPFRFEIVARNISTLSHVFFHEKSFWHKTVISLMTRWFYIRVDKIIAQSRGMALDLMENFNISKKKISVVHNFIAKKNQNEDAIPFSERSNYLLCVGRLEKTKAFHYAIRAFAKISNDYPTLRLKFLGKGALEEDLKKLSVKLKVDDRIDFEGFQSNLIPFYQNARLTLLTSLYEGFPNVLIESISLGTPTVAFNCPSGPDEIIIDGINGYLVNHLDEKDLVSGLIKGLERDWIPAEVAKTASRFDNDKIVEEYINVLSK